MPQLLDAGAIDFRGIVRPGSYVCWGQAAAEPLVLTRRLMEQRHEIGRFSAFIGISLGDTPSLADADVVRFESFCGSGTNRRLAAAGRLDILPLNYSDLTPVLVGKVDVLLIQVAEHPTAGTLSLSPNCDYLLDLARSARVVVAELNAEAPVTDAVIDPADIDLVVRTARPLPEQPASPPLDVADRIAAHVAELIDDRATVQFGIGAIPDAIAMRLGDRRDLGLHTGLLTDGGMGLIEGGVVTNACKGIDIGVSVAGGLLGSRRLCAFAHLNPRLSLRPVTYTHSVAVMARIAGLIAINSALEVDLSGAANCEVADGRYVGAVGGAIDFVRGACASRGGIPVLALPATVGAGQTRRSRIVPSLSGPATIARADAGVIVTEFGRADLRGASLAERRRRLVDIAAPEFREALERS